MRHAPDPRLNRDQREKSRGRDDWDDTPEMKRRERFQRPSDRTPASISTKRALLLLAVCIFCILVTRTLAGW